jgi:hypothetical protein
MRSRHEHRRFVILFFRRLQFAAAVNYHFSVQRKPLMEAANQTLTPEMKKNVTSRV